MKQGFRRFAFASLPIALIFATPAMAQSVSIGLASEPTSVDPHFHNLTPNNALRQHIFEALTTSDENMLIQPGLATSWEATSDTTWEFKLREGVTFSDGTPFTAADVIYSFCRVPLIEGSPSSFTSFIADVVDIETPDDSTIIFTTSSPAPLLPTNLAQVGIVSAANFGGENAEFGAEECANLGDLPASTDFSDPEVAIGTGPFILTGYTPGDEINLARNSTYWGEAPVWEEVTLRPITSPGSRVASLLAGDVDVIETPPIQDFDRIQQDGFEIVQGLSNRVIYLHFTHGDEVPPGVSGTDGVNPFTDVRVREAISKAINREAIVDRVMGGFAVAAGELLPYPLFGTSPDAEPDPFDPEAAQALLAEAGFPNGFEITLSSPNDRYINDERIAQAVAQFLSRVGIRTDVDAMTVSTFFGQRNQGEFGFWLAGWGAASGELSNPLTALVATRDTDTGMGSTNRQGYSNPEIDALIVEARQTVDDDARRALLQQASKMAMEDYATVPLHFEMTPWAYSPDFTVTPRVDQSTLATGIRPAD